MPHENGSKDEKPESYIWQTYLDAAKNEDEARPKNWEGSTNGILTFTGLFAATVAAFIVESYTLLSPDSSDRTNVLLEQLFVAMANTSSNIPVVVPPIQPFSVAPTAVVINVLWFSSLLISLTCALLATLVQEWSRAYPQDINKRKVLHETIQARACNHIFIRMGVDRYGMDHFVSWIVALVHLSVLLFACGLVIFLYPINSIVVGMATIMLGTFCVLYCISSVLPFSDKSCPYRTPLSYFVALFYWLALRSRRMIGLQSRSREVGINASKCEFDSVITRQYTGDPNSFMTDSRFRFMWDHTYVHISDRDSGRLFKGLGRFISLHEGHDIIQSRLCADRDFMRRLWHYLQSLYVSSGKNASLPSIDTGIFELVILLSERMFALEVELHGDRVVDSESCTSPLLLDVIGEISWIAEREGPSQLLAQICLSRVRWSFLKLCYTAFKKEMPTPDGDGMPNFIRNASELYRFRLDGRHPSGLLPMLTTGFYDGHIWRYRDVSVLSPLHDDDCCKSGRSVLSLDSLAHVIACNAFTTVAHILRSSDSQRRRMDDILFGFFHRVKAWEETLRTLQERSSHKMPSSEFISVLRIAGLHEWLEPGSTFLAEPRSDGPNYDFLTEHSGAWNSGPHCVHLLRDLAQCVDFAAYRERMDGGLAVTTSGHATPDEPRTTTTATEGQTPGGKRDTVFSKCTREVDMVLSCAAAGSGPSAAHDSHFSSPDEKVHSPPSSRDDSTSDSEGSVMTVNLEQRLVSDSQGEKSEPIIPVLRDVVVVLEQRAAAPVQDLCIAAVSTSHSVNQQMHEQMATPEPLGLTSIRVDDDRSSREDMIQNGDEMTIIAGV